MHPRKLPVKLLWYKHCTDRSAKSQEKKLKEENLFHEEKTGENEILKMQGIYFTICTLVMY